MRVLAEIPPRSSPDLRTGALRRGDLEAFAGLREELRDARVVLMTGEGPGRRQAAAGLAAAAAAAGARTALLECELADPGLADALGVAGAPGLHEYLRGNADAGSVLAPVVLAGPGSAAAAESLVCIVAGRPAADAAMLLGSQRFRHAVSGLRDAYELLVIDGPPFTRQNELLTVMAVADVTLACVDSAAARPSLPAPITGLVVRG